MQKFRIYYNGRSGLYFLAVIHDTHAALLKAGDYEREPGTQGFFSPYQVQRMERGVWRTLPIVGELHLHRERLTWETISHECVHAALAWARRKRFDFARLGAPDSINADEEKFTYVCSYIIAETVGRIHERHFRNF